MSARVRSETDHDQESLVAVKLSLPGPLSLLAEQGVNDPS